MYKLVRSFLFLFDSEVIHKISTKLIKLLNLLPFTSSLLRKRYYISDKSLEKELFGIKFPNPIGLAAGFDKTESGLRYKVIQKGNGKKANKADQVSVHYKGQLADGTVFDSSYKRNQPLDFQVGVGQVISGWDEGIQLLNVGDKARFVIPSHLGYGSRGAGGVIPPNATLIFDVELMDVK